MKINRSSYAGILASGVAVVALTTGGVAAAGSTASASGGTQTTQTAQVTQIAQTMRTGSSDNMHGMHGMHGMFERVLHGEFVMAKPGGGHQTVLVQRGSVQSVGPSEISLRSSDGFKGSYSVGAETLVVAGRNGIGSIKAGDQVAVAATGSTQNATAVHVFDLSLLKSHHGKQQMPR